MQAEGILIVEDNQLNLMLIKTMLNGRHYDVRTAENAEEALLLLSTFHPKVILMDIQLPGMDGLTLTRQIKANPQFKETAIIAVTAYAMKGDREKALAAGCDEYVSKPIDIKTFPDMVAKYLAVSVNRP
ncbi:MAG TPA: response regulator [Gammaproteobacteria bacterium]|jgi:CheY-like chemotaxis protein|nr:response regulator [Gammaproteobacteria bacterium]